MLRDFDNIKTSDYYDCESKNFFNIQEEFFVIDSEHLDDIQSRMYGFSIQNTGIFEEENMTAESVAGLDGCGTYVYIERNLEEGRINIYQDYNGSYGIYIFHNGKYFALSNSFFCLLDHVKYRFPLSLNRDYSNHILLDPLASYAYSETAVKEIQLLSKDVFIQIDINSATYHLIYIDYKEDSFNLDTAEGIAILDCWFQKWTNVFRNIKSQTDQITVNLSGGIDSRLTFMLMLKSGIDLNEIRVNTFTDGLHTHSEDYRIASEIASYYGFKLNNKNMCNKAINYSLEDIINIEFYTKMTFHKEMYYKYCKFYKKRFAIPGSGGESIRAYWDISAEDFIKEQEKHAKQRYSQKVATDISLSVRRILEAAYNKIDEKYNIEDKNSKKYPWLLHRESRDRSHFGKAIVEDFFSNIYTLTPLIDPDIRKIKLNTDDCLDKNLLTVLIFTRYCPSLLDFQFEGGRSFDPKTIRKAQNINEKFPINDKLFTPELKNDFVITVNDKNVNNKLNTVMNNKPLMQGIPDKYLKAVFDSCGLRKLFATCFDEEIYTYASYIARETNYYPLRECYAIIGLTRVIEDIFVGNYIQKPSLLEEMDKFISSNYYKPIDYGEIIKNSINFLTLRIDIIFKGLSSDGEVIEISDEKAIVKNPEWIQKDGKGYVIESCCGTLDLTLRAITEGEIYISLRGRDVRDNNNIRIPYWVDITDFQLNKEKQFEGLITVCHDKPFPRTLHINANDLITLHLKWKPHNNTNNTIESEKQIVEERKIVQEKNEVNETYKLSTWEFLKHKIKNYIKKF